MHPEAVPPGIETLPPLDEVEVSEMSVAYSRTLPPAPLADWEAEATGLPRDAEYRRREEGTFVSPALHVQRYAIEAEDGGALAHVRIQGFTPESPTDDPRLPADRAQLRRPTAPWSPTICGRCSTRWPTRDAAVLETVQRQLGEDVEPAARHQREGRPRRAPGAPRRPGDGRRGGRPLLLHGLLS